MLINTELKVSSSPMEILSSSIPITKSQMTMSTTMVPSTPLTEGIYMVLFFTINNVHRALYLLINTESKVSSSPMEILSSPIPITKSQMTMSTTMVPSSPLADAGQTLRITLQIVNQQNVQYTVSMLHCPLVSTA